MFRNKSKSLHFNYFIRFSFAAYARQLCSKPLLPEERCVAGSANLTDFLEEKLKAMQQRELEDYLLRSSKTSIYRVPAKLRQIEPKAYEPHFISIGPYHHGSPNLQPSEKLKWLSLTRLIGFGERARDELDKLVTSLEAIEHKARCCYSEDVKLSKREFVTMMLLNRCFIVELFQDLRRIVSSLHPSSPSDGCFLLFASTL
ncbi:UPF0481 protein At3g47200-like [Chenopodium quinoa]|uniref:UPF0481 protein At3g47200-like n=1 Tax=Chenopodium quinoa TaxID=63459 RepID=UPI000B794510|nr:UPF0481 protein At3g47200-like [Chenopodium quinoa]